jgi:glycerol-3-phosphate acyltransferase PlsY
MRLHVPEIIFSVLIALLVVLRHIPNIRRLIAGTENRIGRRK